MHPKFTFGPAMRDNTEMSKPRIRVIGGGLAGPEAALQAAAFGCEVTLYEMRPHRSTEAHLTSDFAELVCSNSLKSESENSAPWLLKQEMRLANSFLLAAAHASQVPAGHALAVDRQKFSDQVNALIESNSSITVVREEVICLDPASDEITILATGPLTSPALTAELQRLTGSQHLAFYDSISPIVEASSIDMDKVYLAARWDKGTADYINCPFTKEEYERFIEALSIAETVPAKEWEHIPTVSQILEDRHPEAGEDQTFVADEDRHAEEAQPLSERHLDRSVAERRDPLLSPNPSPIQNFPATSTTPAPKYFEGCLPIEEIARRGRDTLRFGPMKPAGLTNPRTGRWPYAAVQLRQENLRADSWNIVGFQNHMKYSEQARVLRLIPGLENAKFLRYGQIHRNTYLNSPTVLTSTLQLKDHPRLLVAGQLSGVEGYTESIAGGLLAGRFAAALAHGRIPEPPPRLSAHGSLIHYITHSEAKNFQPANITFDLLLPLEEELRKKIRDKKERHRMQCERALDAWGRWLESSEQPEVRA
jgi:methylenetetrahydrofolate--tRNA-(uracil-5-)-methyltransferase